MKALTIWPEWCWAICRLGKNIENRSRRPPSTLSRDEPLAIHAGVSLGGRSGYTRIDEVFAPVDSMARRAGWRIGVNVAENRVQVYSVKTPGTISQKVHEVPRGCVVAVARVGGILVPGEDDPDPWPWWTGECFGWFLRDVRIIERPVVCRGKQGVWRLSDTAAKLVDIQLADA